MSIGEIIATTKAGISVSQWWKKRKELKKQEEFKNPFEEGTLEHAIFEVLIERPSNWLTPDWIARKIISLELFELRNAAVERYRVREAIRNSIRAGQEVFEEKPPPILTVVEFRMHERFRKGK